MRHSLVFLLVVCALLQGDLLAQQLPFVHYSPKDGLVSNRARFACQDYRGRIYFATYGGLSVYDGSVFTNYTVDDGLATSMVNDVIEMGKDSLWVLSNTSKVHCLVNGKLKDLVTSDGFCPVISTIIKAGNGSLYALADGGLYKFHQNRFVRLDVRDDRGREMNKHFISGVEHHNKIFIITDHTIGIFPAPARLIVFDILTGKSIINETQGGIYSVIVSPRKEILVGTIHGLKLIDTIALRQGRISFAALPSMYRSAGKLVGHYLYFDRQENLWMVCYNGIQKISRNGSGRMWTMANGLQSNFHFSIFQDRENIFWLMNGSTGISKLSNPDFELYPEIAPGFQPTDIYANPRSDSVWFIDADHQNILLRHANGENIFSVKHKLRSHRITVGSKNAYISGDSGIYEIKLPVATNKIKPRLIQITNDSNKAFGPMCLLTNSNGDPVAVNINATAFIGKNIYNYPLGYVADQCVISPDNRLWTITRSKKLFVFDLDEKNINYFKLLKIFEKELPNFSPRSITLDRSGKVWVGSRDHGLFCFSIDKNLNLVSWQQVTMKEGLSDNFISYLHCDGKNNIWACSPAGVDKLQLVKNTIFIENITRRHNMYQPVTKVQTSANGVTWILSVAGIIRLAPSENFAKDYKANIFFTNIQAGNKSIHNSQLNLSLPFNENDMSFRMAAPSFIDEKQIRFSYRLVGGANKQWSELSSNAEIRFINLSPGKYTVHAKAIFLNGIYPETTTSYSFEILPPWWQTWWFRILLATLLIGISTIIVRMYFKRKLQKQLILFEKQQAIELERSRIASDMHDDLGAGLSTIRFLSEKVKRNSFSEVTRDDANKIVVNSNELVEKMNDIIWAMNEKNDSMEDLLFYSRSYAMEYCEDNNLECHVFLPNPIPDLFISGEIRRNVFLTIKESLHNIVKHASASRVEIRFEMDEQLMVRIMDNGKGMVDEKQGEGNGLLNMQKRVALLNGSLRMKSEQGVVIEFFVPVRPGFINREDQGEGNL